MYTYYPILKWKQGEFGALKELQAEIKKNITPIIEIPPIPWDFAKEKPSKTIDKHVEKIPFQIKKAWGNPDSKPSILIDFAWLENEAPTSQGKLAREYIADEISGSVTMIPVTGFRRSPSYQQFVQGKKQHGVCLRIEKDDIFNEDIDLDEESIKEEIDIFLDSMSIRPDNCLLLIDMGYIEKDSKGLAWPTIKNIFYEIPYLEKWKEVVFSSTGFPENLSNVEKDSVEDIPRTEWFFWKKLAKIAREKGLRVPSFGDYGISNPMLPSIDPRFMRMSASIRYTWNDQWRIYKGKNVKTYSFDQFFDLSKMIVEDESTYYGKEYSWGDAYISKCAQRETGCGNATTWRRVGNSHHITLVVNQLKDFFANSHEI